MGKTVKPDNKKLKADAKLRASIREANAIRKAGGPARAAWEKNLAAAKAQQVERLVERAKKDAAAAPPAGQPDREAPPPPAWFKMPSTLGACADALYKYRAERLELARKEKEFEGAERALRDHLIELLPKSDAGGISGKVARVTVKTKPVPRVEDWDKFYAGIVAEYQRHARRKDGLESGAFALLNRALTKGAVEEHWKKGEELPGVGSFNATTLSVEKL